MNGRGPVGEFVAELGTLWQDAGRPTRRAIGARSGVPSSSVQNALSGHSWPRWDTASAIIEALGGDPSAHHELWARGDAARRKPTTLSARAGQQDRPSADARLIAGAIREGLAEIAAVIREQGSQP